MIPVLTADKAGQFSIWDQPQEGVSYVAGVDTAEGRKRDRSLSDRRRLVSYGDSRPDYSAIIVLEMETGRHVATWHGYITPDQYASVCAAVGHYYNDALLVVEINGPGLVVVTRLVETINYPNIYRTRVYNVVDRDPLSPQHGWRTDMHTRKLLVSRVHDVVNSGMAFTRDQRLIGELRTLEFDDQGVERARGSDKDDCVLALGMALQGRYESLGSSESKAPPKGRRGGFDEMVWNRVRERMDQHERKRRLGTDSAGGNLPPRRRLDM